MAVSPVEHAEEARLALRTIVAEHGPATLSNPRSLSNLLADLLPDSPRIARLLVAAAQDRIADELREHTSDGMDAETAARLVASSFADATLFAPDACHWVVAEIALALGLRAEPEPEPGHGPNPDPEPDPESQSERFGPSATARFVADPEVKTLPASTEPASLPGREVPEPRREASPRPVWPKATSQPQQPSQEPAENAESEPTTPPRLTWMATVTADRSYFETVIADGHVEAHTIAFPEQCPPRSFELTGPRMRIGRRSISRRLMPEIDLTGPPLDPGISHLHALLMANEDGSWSVQDAGSSNGTQLNGDEIAIGVPVALREGDRICLGAWTVVTVSSR